MNNFPEQQPTVVVGCIPYVGVTEQEEVGSKEGGNDSVMHRSKNFSIVHGDDGTLGCYQNSAFQDIFDVGVE